MSDAKDRRHSPVLWCLRFTLLVGGTFVVVVGILSHRILLAQQQGDSSFEFSMKISGNSLSIEARSMPSSKNLAVDSSASQTIPAAQSATKGGLPIPMPNDLPPSAACVLFSDDNALVPEWIAYHYFALGLRRLVVAVDPRSATRPSLEAWRPYINITEWNDNDFGYRPRKPRRKEKAGSVEYETNIHLGRQPFFYRECGRLLQSTGYTWTMFHDLDEYVALNERAVPDAKARVRQPSGVLRAFVDATRSDDRFLSGRNCTLIDRTLFSTVESSDQDRPQLPVSGLDLNRLYTIRYQHGEGVQDGMPKSLVNVAAMDFDKEVVQNHRVSSMHCSPIDRPRVLRGLLVIHHYLGPWAGYARANDARKGGLRNRQGWEFRAAGTCGKPMGEIVPWLDGFVEAVGAPTAADLLREAGFPPNGPEEDPKEWELSVDYVKHLIDVELTGRRDRKYRDFLVNWLALREGKS